MNKIRKAMLLAGCAVSSIGLAGCKDSKNNSSTTDTTNSYWLITEVGKYDVLFDAKNLNYWKSGGIVSFITYDDKEFVASDFFIFGHDNKPANELYDVEYGTKEWYDLYTDTETDSQNLTYTSNMLEENNL